MNCPKCNFTVATATDECPNCGIFMSKWKPRPKTSPGNVPVPNPATPTDQKSEK
jgi:ssDNA-binding Zn-finger/Zn-ribbon topoisomerase 1